LLERNSATSYTILKNNLKFGNVEVASTIHFTNGNFGMRSSDNELEPFFAHTEIIGEMGVIFNDPVVKPLKTVDTIFWSLEPDY
jgi:hypothetical protein